MKDSSEPIDVPVVHSFYGSTSAQKQVGRLFYGHVALLVASVDFLLIIAASLLAGICYHLVAYDRPGDISGLFAVGFNAAFIFVLVVRAQGLYRPAELISKATQFRSVILSWVVALLMLSLLLFLLKISERYSRGATVGFAFTGLGFLLLSRAVIATKLSEALRLGTLAGHRAVVVGDPKELAHVSAIHLLERYGMREIGRCALSPSSGSSDGLAASDRRAVDEAIEFAQAYRAEKVLLALPWSDTRRCQLVSEQLRLLPLQVLLLPDRVATSILSRPILEIGSHPAVELSRAPLSTLELVLKRTLDLVVAASALVLFAPLLALVGLAIKLETRGPILFRQDRMGFNGRQFKIYKFRTMTVQENGSTIRQAKPNDDRVTAVGRVLRSTSIDELPQLMNVLGGEMSLVGPRPHAIAHHAEYQEMIAAYAFRHHVKPGITGWAQVNGLRGETERVELMVRRVEHDLWYIRNWTIVLDLRILVRTCFEIMRARNAH